MTALALMSAAAATDDRDYSVRQLAVLRALWTLTAGVAGCWVDGAVLEAALGGDADLVPYLTNCRIGREGLIETAWPGARYRDASPWGRARRIVRLTHEGWVEAASRSIAR